MSILNSFSSRVIESYFGVTSHTNDIPLIYIKAKKKHLIISVDPYKMTIFSRGNRRRRKKTVYHTQLPLDPSKRALESGTSTRATGYLALPIEF